MSTVAQLGSAAAARVGELLARTCFAERVEAARTGGFATYEPWPPVQEVGQGAGGPGAPGAGPARHRGDDLGEDLWRLAHLGVVERERFSESLWSDLRAVDLVADGEPARRGRFELTAHRSLIAARDRPRGSVRGGVHIGEDSLRFAEAILGVAPRGVALDVGCGSGISTCALGRTCEQVHAIDVVEACLDATALSMGLNGMGAKASVSLAQLDAYEPPQRFDCAIGNLPGVPVPPGLHYPPDGAGGLDGLELMRLFLERCQSTLLGERGIAIMRFQSLGDEDGPLLLAELRELAPRAGWDISVMTESRIPASVRAALTAHHALPVNDGIDPLEMLARADAHLADLGHHEYYASTLFARPAAGASGSVIYTDLSGLSLVGHTLRLARSIDVAVLMGSAIPAYYGRAHDLPDSFFELGSLDFIHQPAMRLEQILECLTEPLSVPELVERVFSEEVDRDPIRARFLQITVELLASCLLRAGALVS
ncbi:MAG TPA: hypothetical protein VGY76_00830 [Solirubrobacteraceae bacterium]|jgi:hypothetical protein|nr:hypothetical protein [Solirubrobacteraceae bacterium]